MFLFLSKFNVFQSVTTNKALIIISGYFVLVFNISFLIKTYHVVSELADYNLFFLISIPILLCCIFVIFFGIFSAKRIFKPLVFFFIILSATMTYATISYGIVFDYGMIENTMQTSRSEALTYVNLNAFFIIFVFSILPLVYLFKLNIIYKPFKSECIVRVKCLLTSTLFIFSIVFFFYQDYASVGRNNNELTSYITPLKSVVSGYKFIRNQYFITPKKFTLLDENPTLIPLKNQQKRIILMVVGETARAENFAYNGYQKPTNQFTKTYKPLSFKHITSCGTATAVSVPCMFSALGRKEYDKQTANSQQNLLDLVKLANVDVLWLDNNEGCKGACNRVTTLNTDKHNVNALCDGNYCFDEVLLSPLKDKLAHLTHQTTLIVVHLIGSHGPTYYRRYPHEFSMFLPDCQRSDIQNCTHEQIVNTYDNTIAYSDYILSKMMAELTTLSSQHQVEASLLYVSDHGESLGEKGLYLHGFPYALAPEQQTHIPMLFWTSNPDQNKHACENNLITSVYSHDNVFHTVLGLTQVESTAYNENLDIFHPCSASNLLAKSSH